MLLFLVQAEAFSYMEDVVSQQGAVMNGSGVVAMTSTGLWLAVAELPAYATGDVRVGDSCFGDVIASFDVDAVGFAFYMTEHSLTDYSVVSLVIEDEIVKCGVLEDVIFTTMARYTGYTSSAVATFEGGIVQGIAYAKDHDGSFMVSGTWRGLEADVVGNYTIRETCDGPVMVQGTYETNGTGIAEVESHFMGLTIAQVLGKYIVIDDQLACGLLCDVEGLVAVFEEEEEEESHDDHHNEEAPGINVVGALRQLEPNLGEMMMMMNPHDSHGGHGGGFHIHQGSTCTEPLGHYNEGLAYDPWENTTIQTNSDGVAIFNFHVPFFSLSSGDFPVLDHPVVVHDSFARVSCGLLQEDP